MLALMLSVAVLHLFISITSWLLNGVSEFSYVCCMNRKHTWRCDTGRLWYSSMPCTLHNVVVKNDRIHKVFHKDICESFFRAWGSAEFEGGGSPVRAETHILCQQRVTAALLSGCGSDVHFSIHTVLLPALFFLCGVCLLIKWSIKIMTWFSVPERKKREQHVSQKHKQDSQSVDEVQLYPLMRRVRATLRALCLLWPVYMPNWKAR